MLRSLFGPGREEIWRQLSSEIGAVYEEGGLLGADAVRASLGEHSVTLDTYTVSSGNSSATYTRMRAPFVNPEGLRFRIYRASLFTPVGRFFGLEDIEVGDPDFDHDFVVQSNDAERVRALLANASLRSLLAVQPRFHLEVEDDEGFFGRKYGADVDVLTFQVPGVMKELAHLRALFRLYDEVLHALAAPHPAGAREPGATGALLAELEPRVAPFAGYLARAGDAVKARLSLGELDEALEATLSVTLPELPANTCDVELEAALPGDVPELLALPKRGLSSHLAGLRSLKVGLEELEDRFVFEGAPEAAPLVAAFAAPLQGMAAWDVRVTLQGQRLEVLLPSVPRDAAPAAAELTLELWRRAARRLAGIG